MLKAINVIAINAVFEAVDTSSTSFTARLFVLGVCTRAIAKPLAMQWAAKKYGVKIVAGQRGDTLPRGSAAEQAVKRVIETCFPAAEQVSSKATSAKKVDPVVTLLKKYAALSGVEKRRFMATLGK
tara:strand:+ start:1538 stop:1915 length:378 start_codon:yes stop_codon:yes gene_type:complete